MGRFQAGTQRPHELTTRPVGEDRRKEGGGQSVGQLLAYFPRQLVGICAGDKEGALVAAVAAVTLNKDDGFMLSFPKRNPFSVGDPVTVHLDDRG